MRVKKLGWIEYTSKRGKPIAWEEDTTLYGDYRIDKTPKMYNVFIRNSSQGYFKDIDEAKEYCQKHFNDVVSSYIEVSDDLLPQTLPTNLP